MKFFTKLALFVMILFPTLASSQWISAYYAGWLQGNQWSWHLQAQDVDYSAVTHVFHFSIDPKANGGFAWSDLSDWQCKEAVKYAHQAGKKIVISVGGWGSWSAFNAAIKTDSIRAIFVQTLVNFMATYDYDGIDIDAEPINNATLWRTFITDLKAAMPTGKLLTCAVMTEDAAVVQVASKFDQINIMTYDMSGAWPGWVTWHNAPISNGGKTFPSTGGALPSCEWAVNFLTSRGVPKSKIGIGLDWYGYAWKGGAGTPTGGVTEPFQSYTTDPSVEGNIPYYDIVRRWPTVPTKWDESAKAAYLSIDAATNSNDYFISYDNERTGKAKVDYVRSAGLGGIIVWELGGGYVPNATQPDFLLQQLKLAWQDSTYVPPVPQIPVAPSNLIASAIGTTKVNLNWIDNSNNELGFRIERNTQQIATVGPNIASYSDINLSPNTVYSYRISAYNNDGQSVYSNVDTAKTFADVLPPTPCPDSLAIYQHGYAVGFIAGVASVPPPAICPDSLEIYNLGFAAGVASVETGVDTVYVVKIDTIYVDVVRIDTVYVTQTWDEISYTYVNGEKFPSDNVVLPKGSIFISKNYSSVAKTLTVVYLKPIIIQSGPQSVATKKISNRGVKR